MERKFRFSFLLLAGILLLGAGLIGLTSVPDVMQYAFLPSTVSNTEAALPLPAETSEVDASALSEPAKKKPEVSTTPLLDLYEKAAESMGELFPRLTMHGVKAGETLSIHQSDRRQEGIYLYAIGPHWNEVYYPHVLKGRILGTADVEAASEVIVLDEKTAFTLFTDADPIDQPVAWGEKRLEVAGVAPHSRRIGETGEYAAWVPLDLMTNADLMILSAPAGSGDLFPAFKKYAENVIGKGTPINLAQEKFRALLPLLLVAVIAAIWLMKRWIGKLGSIIRIQVEKVRAESKRRYVMRLLPYAAGQMLPVVLLIALTIAVCFGVAVVALRPMLIFPEWVPETLGEYEPWVERFWQLVGVSAQPVTLKTPELAEVQFWSSLVLWGTFVILLRAAKQTLTGMFKKNS